MQEKGLGTPCRAGESTPTFRPKLYEKMTATIMETKDKLCDRGRLRRRLKKLSLKTVINTGNQLKVMEAKEKRNYFRERQLKALRRYRISDRTH